MTTAETITDSQIKTLRQEAGQAGDMVQVEICNKALNGELTEDSYELLHHEKRNRVLRMTQEECRAECARVIADAEAQVD